jgi:hypothetical protein
MKTLKSNKYSRRNFLQKISTVFVLGTSITNIKSRNYYKEDSKIEDALSQINVKGIVDIHVHGNTRRKGYGHNLTSYETALAMAEYGVKAWVDKEKRGYTWSVAEVLRRVVPGTITLGSLVLDKTVGGINPSAVIAATSGAGIYAAGDSRVIWMPSSTEQIDKDVFITNSNGELLQETKEVLKIISETNVVLATGHLPYKHIIKLVPEAKQIGVEKIMITHPDWLSIEEQKELCKYGVFFDRCIGTWPWWKKSDFKELKNNPELFKSLVKQLVENMRKVGMERNIISTDWGPHTFWDSPPLAMKQYIWALMENGVTENEIDMLVRKIPSYLVGV